MDAAAVMWLLVVIAGAALFFRLTRPPRPGDDRRPPHVGPAAIGSVYGFLNEDKQKAVELVVEGRAAANDPEDRDGNLPDLEHPR
jgi:hypothetical protein